MFCVLVFPYVTFELFRIIRESLTLLSFFKSSFAASGDCAAVVHRTDSSFV